MIFSMAHALLDRSVW